jgi:hypothetical protein
MKPLSYSIRHHKDCHLNADSKHCHHHLRPDKTESLHCDKQSTLIANIGNVKYDSLKILDLREGATTEGEVKAAFQAMSRVWHPEKNN